MNNSHLTAYALDFVSFLIQKTRNRNKIRNIILFGSVARQDESKESDIDIFVDILEDNKIIEKEINFILENFTDSVKYKNYWKLFGIKNEIKLNIGNIDNWKELKPSLIADGIVLYGKYKPKIKEGQHNVFFIWENIKPNAKRVLFNKKVFGYKQNKKSYHGLLVQYKGERLGKGCIVVPIEHSSFFHSLFKKFKVNVRIKKVLEYY
ncbi:nucleotidyltransferase domain-containing protein [Candidatus Pacearchaeota archaeon]|nr:nucleotidyltransferase domain-containing protein [Candidatus Pacearchaeota archaeon]